MAEKFDVAVVGAGVAGLSAAYLLAKQGLKVIIIEKGQHAGSKNVMGGVLYRSTTDEIFPGYTESAPLERPVVEQNYWLITETSAVKTGFRDQGWAEKPYNCHTIFRSKFDHWLAKKCVEAGALLINETLVESCVMEGSKVIGVATGREDGVVLADVVILADGINSILGRDLGFHREWRADQVALAVMEQIALPSEKIEDRFSLEKGMGATIEMFGDSTRGMPGTAFIYTNKDHLSIGCGAALSHLREAGLKPYALLEYVKQHPMIRPLIAGGKPVEYYAHLIPEGGFLALPRLCGDGVLVVGDAAQLVNSLHREGSNLAMTSGRFAAEAILRARTSNDFSRAGLRFYEEALRGSFVMKDLKKYKNAVPLLEKNPHYFDHYIPAANSAMREFFTVDGITKNEKEKRIFRGMLRDRSLVKTAADMFKLFRAVHS